MAMLLINYLANSIPIGGNTTGDISGQYNTLFTPAGFTFSIWGVIYLLLIIFIVMLFTTPDGLSTNKTPILILFNGANLLNIAWLFSWHNDRILLSTVVMMLLLISLLTILVLLSKSDVFAFATFSIYAGWISVATIANIAILITKLNLSFFMNYETIWFALIIIVSLIIGGYMLIKEKNIYYASVFAWAYIGIIAKFI
jgi:tryptophan-rich sensory protein